MVNPVTGPFYREVGDSFGSSHSTATWYRQKPPYTLPLPYEKRTGQVSNLGPGSSRPWQWEGFAQSVDSSRAYNQAYDRLVGKLGDTAGLGVSLVQWREADAMIRNRGNQLRSFGVALARRNPLGVAASLGLSIRQVQAIMRTRYGVARSLSDLWLEFWFGWKPAVSDIYTACEVFNRDIPWGRIRASGEQKTPLAVRVSPFCDVGCSGHAYSTRCKVSLGVDVRLVNPNVNLLNQLGLLNPGLVAFDAIPWSFVLGWFVNVESWLRSFTDFAGWELRNGYISTQKEVFGNSFWSGPAPYNTWGNTGHGFLATRGTVSTFPRPRLQLKELSLKPARALTAITLLVQQLPKR